MAARETDGRREQLRERASAGCVRPDGGGARGGSSEAGGAYEGDGDGFMGQGRGRRPAQGLNNNGKTVNDRAGHARHEDPALPFGERELNPIARGPLTTSTSVDLPLSLPQFPHSLIT